MRIFLVPAEAKQRRAVACIETGAVMAPICGMGGNLQASLAGSSGNILAGVRSIRVTMKRERAPKEINLQASHRKHLGRKAELKEITPEIASSPGIGYSAARPIRYIAGQLICAINVNAALAERGIRGTGSALARSYDRWGVRVAQPVPGAVAVTDRRGGGHVAIVSRVEGSRVFVWNPSARGRGWREVEYTNRHARYRVASVP